jgi:hypothetical protein
MTDEERDLVALDPIAEATVWVKPLPAIFVKKRETRLAVVLASFMV